MKINALILVTLLMFAVVPPVAGQDVTINITGSGSSAKYIEAGETTQKPVHVKVGETVRWNNSPDTTRTHTATAFDPSGNRIFDTGNITVNSSADVLMDRDVFEDAGGTAGGSVTINYLCALHAGTMSSSIILEDSPLNGSGHGSTTTALLVRKEVSSLTSTEIASLRAGVAAMKARPTSDKTSWRFWANIHWTSDFPVDPLWNQCEHSPPATIHFLTWHRAYLLCFEKVLRDASGDPNLALPYWNWTNNRTLPLIYRSPADASNSLFEVNRQMNFGGMLPSSLVVNDLQSAMNETSFFNFSLRLEGSPHGSLHGAIGGPGGTMSSISRAANDPVFWAHHGNIDRLWNRWLDQGGGRENPTSSSFLNREFTFPDVNGNNVSIKVADLLNQNALGYRYDDEPEPTPTPDADVIVSSESDFDSGPIDLGFAATTVAIPLTDDATDDFDEIVAASTETDEDTRLVIEIVDVQFKETPGYAYGVYLQLPENEMSADRKQQHYVGSVSFFTHGEHGTADHDDASGVKTFTARLDATDIAKRLKAAGVEWGEEVTVTLEPITLIPAAGEEEASAQRNRAAAAAAAVKYRYVVFRKSRE